MPMLIYKPVQADREEFVRFWGRLYTYENEKLYTENIGQELTEACILQLYEWKNGMRLSGDKLKSVHRNFIRRRGELAGIDPDITPGDFLARFDGGGAIWRIFWMHCWQPNRFPIYDQHVHRAMSFIENSTPEEIPETDLPKIETYLNRYLPFHAQFQGIDEREVDRAIWVFGKFIKDVNFPEFGKK